jgi:hypothetical protein
MLQVKKILPFSGELDIKNEPLDNEDGAATVHRLRYSIQYISIVSIHTVL